MQQVKGTKPRKVRDYLAGESGNLVINAITKHLEDKPMLTSAVFSDLLSLLPLDHPKRRFIVQASKASRAYFEAMDRLVPDGLASLDECQIPESLQTCTTPSQAASYWRRRIKTDRNFDPECECFAVLMLNARLRVKGHYVVAIGTLNNIIVHPREVFRRAIAAAAKAIVLLHNHPSGDPAPSRGDIKATREFRRAGRLLRIDVVDHVIMGNPGYSSLRELGYFPS